MIVRKFLSWSIRKQLFILIFIMTVVPIGIILLSAYNQRMHDIREAYQQAERLADDIGNDQKILLSGAEQLLSTLSHLPAVQKHDKKTVNALLAELVNKNAQYANLLITDNTGLQWAAAIQPKGPISLADRRYFRNAIMTGHFSSGEYGVGRTLKKPVLNFAYPIKDTSGAVTDVAVVVFTLEKYKQRFQLKTIPANTSLVLVDHKGTFLFSVTTPQNIGKQDREDLFRGMSEGPDKGSFEATSNSGIRRYFACQKLRLEGESTPYMYVRVGIQAEPVLGENRSKLLFDLGLMTSMLLVVTLLASYISRRGIVDKVIALRDATQKIAQGDLEVRVTDYVSGGELGELGRSFDEMTHQLSEDINRRNLAEQTLRESNERFSIAFNNAPLMMTISSLDDGTYLDVNQQFTASSGFSREEAIGRTSVALGWISKPDRDQLSEIISKEGKIHNHELRLHSKSGQTILCKYWGELVTFSGQKRLLSLALDITVYRTVEQQFLQAQKMESLGVLAGGIAHDFNNILTSIVGNTELALMRLNPESPVFDNLQRIEKSAARATDLAKQMLAYSGKGKFVVDAIDLNHLVKEIGRLLEVSISKKVVLRFNLADHLPLVEADATQIRQIVMNLVINAAEAIGEKSGVIEVSTGYIECDLTYLNNHWLNATIAEGRYVFLEVADNGCGMDKETQARIFDPFFTTKFTGRGLGMAAVLGIIRGHKGAINVFSEPGQGSSFKILLPAGTKPVEQFSEEKSATAFKGAGKVLLVDDEEAVRNIGSEMLRELGFVVITANDGRDGIEAFKSNPGLFCVILDLTMPNMDGGETFQKLRLLDPDVKVLMASGYSDFEVSQNFAGKGLAGFIQKPYNLSMFEEALRKI